MRLWKHDIALLAFFTLALWVIYFSYPPYAVPMILSHLSGTIVGLYAILRFLFENKNKDRHAFLKLVVRLFVSLLLVFAEITRNSFE